MNLNKSCIEIVGAFFYIMPVFRWTLTRVVLKWFNEPTILWEYDGMNLNKSCIEIVLYYHNTKQPILMNLNKSCIEICTKDVVNPHLFWWTLTRVVLKYISWSNALLGVFWWTLTRVVLKYWLQMIANTFRHGWTLTRVVLKSFIKNGISPGIADEP